MQSASQYVLRVQSVKRGHHAYERGHHTWTAREGRELRGPTCQDGNLEEALRRTLAVLIDWQLHPLIPLREPTSPDQFCWPDSGSHKNHENTSNQLQKVT